jgi:hypothetical protein
MKARRDRTCYSIAIDNEILAPLKELSQRTDLPMAHYIRVFLREGIRRLEKKGGNRKIEVKS